LGHGPVCPKKGGRGLWGTHEEILGGGADEEPPFVFPRGQERQGAQKKAGLKRGGPSREGSCQQKHARIKERGKK